MKKTLFKSITALLLVVLLGCLCGCEALEGLFEPAEKTFKKGDFAITLTEDFEKADMDEFEDYYAGYQTKEETVMVLVLRETFEEVNGMEGLDDYIELSLEANGKPGMAVKKGSGYQYVTYIENIDGQDVHYTAAYYKGADAFYVVTFFTPLENYDTFNTSIEKWAASVEV